MAESSSFISWNGRTCSLSKRFVFLEKGHIPHPKLFPVFPNEELVSIPLTEGEIQFVWKKSISTQKANYHITLAMNEIFANQLNTYPQAICIFLSDKTVSFSLWQNNKHQLMHVYQFETVEDLLFIASKIVEEFGISRETDPVIFSGAVTEDSRVFQLFKIYFRKVILLQHSFPINS